MRVLGIDPGLASCGWAIVEKDSNKNYNLLSAGVISTSSKQDISLRLTTIFFSLKKVISKYSPDVVSVELQFYSRHSKNIVMTYLATGIIYLLCGIMKIKFYEYSAKTVKLSLTGYGSATKFQLKKMVKLLCNLEKHINSEHINDAISVALCYLHTNPGL